MVYYGDLHRHPVEVDHAPDDFRNLGGSDALIDGIDEVVESARRFSYKADGVAFLRDVWEKDPFINVWKQFMKINM